MKKKVIIVLLILGLFGLTIGGIVWFAPQSSASHAIMKIVERMGTKAPKPEDSKNLLRITAVAIGKEYANDEKASDAKYLNKAMEVTGVVGETEQNQDGGLMIILQTEDPTLVVQCSMREKKATASKGQNIKLVGTCLGNGLTGVSLTDCIIK